MASIQSISNAAASFNFNNLLASINGKSVEVINFLKVNTPLAVDTLKNTAIKAYTAAIAMFKTLASYWYHYASIFLVKSIVAIDTFMTSVAATLGPHYPIIATAVVSFALGAGVMYNSMQDQDLDIAQDS